MHIICTQLTIFCDEEHSTCIVTHNNNADQQLHNIDSEMYYDNTLAKWHHSSSHYKNGISMVLLYKVKYSEFASV